MIVPHPVRTCHIMSVGCWTSPPWEREEFLRLTFTSFTPGSQALSTPNFPVDGGLEQGPLGWKCWNLCILRGFAAKGEDFCQQKFPNVEMNWLFLWDEWLGQPWRRQMVCVFFCTRGGRLEMVRRLYILVRLLKQFSVISFPGFNNADFKVAQKGCNSKHDLLNLSSEGWAEFRWCVMLFFWMFDWSISDYLVLFLCFYVNGE